MRLVEPALSAVTAREEHPDSVPRNWGLTAVLVLSAVFWLLAWYGDTARSMVAIWARSDTFAHGFLIAPISAWMIWRRRHVLAELHPKPNYLAMPLLALLGFGWLLGYAADAGVVQQYALVLMIPALVWAILGDRFVRALAFPLFFLVLSVPFGEFLEPVLMEHTADFTIWALRLTGIPVYREGQSFMLPTGSWSVVEACSGLRYLIAALTLGFLYAYLSYRSLVRRALFVVASVVVPIVANWLRAYMIVMIGHLSGMQYAVGIDHLIYGWLFFGLVMMIMFWIGRIWREDQDADPSGVHVVGSGRWQKPALSSIVLATIATAMMVAVWPLAAARLENRSALPAPMLRIPQAAGDWHSRADRLADWTPYFLNPSIRINQTYAKGEKSAGIYIGYYRNQRQGAQLITSANTLVGGRHTAWKSVGQTRRTLTFGERSLSLLETKLRGGTTNLLVWRWYWVDQRYTASPYWGKLLLAKSELFDGSDDGAALIVYARYDNNPAAAEQTMQDFVHAMLPALTTRLEDAYRERP